MRLFRRTNGYWYAEFERGRWISIRTRNADLARKVYRRMRRDFLMGKLVRLDSRSMLLGRFAVEYLDTRSRRMEKSTVAKDSLALRKLLETVGNKALSLLSEADFDAFVSRCLRMGNKKSSVNVYLRHLRSAFNKAMKLGYIAKNPLAGYGMVKEDPRPARFLMPGQVLKLSSRMEADGERDLVAFLWFSVLTGMRRSEVCALEARDVRLDIGLIHVRRSKIHRERWVPVSPLLARLIGEMDLPQVGRIFVRYRHPDTFSHKVKKYLVEAGFGDFRLHDLRHTFASLIAIRGAQQKDIKELLGHSDIRTSDRYTHLAQDRLRAVVSNLGFESKMQAAAKIRLISNGKERRKEK